MFRGYEILNDDEYQKLQNTYQSILIKKEENNSIIEELKKDNKVKKYIDACERNNALKIENESIKKDLLTQKILHCNHFYVLNEIDSSFDGHRTDKEYIYTCIHCGLTNKYYNNDYGHDVYPYSIYNGVIRNHNMWAFGIEHGKYDYKDLDVLEEIYQKYKGEYPEASDEDCERHIKMVMKMRKKKGNKKDD